MKRALLIVLLLASCKEEAAQSVDPVSLTAAAVGHFCQMNLLEHDGPKAQVHLDGLPGTPLFFSQVRDAVAYARLPEQSHPILKIWVNDMGADTASWSEPGADNWIDAENAHFVVGSSRAGGMGAEEFVPFAEMGDATAFAKDFGGRVMRLADIPDQAAIGPVPGTDGLDTNFEDRLRALSQRTGG